MEEHFCAVFQKISSSQKVHGLEGVYQDFPSKIFGLRMPKNMVEEPFCAMFQQISGSQKVYGYEGGSIKIFRRKFSVSDCRKVS